MWLIAVIVVVVVYVLIGQYSSTSRQRTRKPTPRSDAGVLHLCGEPRTPVNTNPAAAGCRVDNPLAMTLGCLTRRSLGKVAQTQSDDC